MKVKVRLPVGTVVGDKVTVTLTESGAAKRMSSGEDSSGLTATAMVDQADIDSRSIDVEFDQAPATGSYTLEEKVTSADGSVEKYVATRTVDVQATETEPAKSDSNGGSVGWGLMMVLSGLLAWRRRR